MTWLTDIILGLRALGGEVPLNNLYRWIERNRQTQLPPNFKSAIRALLQKYCSTAAQYDPTNPDLFSNPSRGWWALRKVSNTATIKLNPMDLLTVALANTTADEIKAMKSEGSIAEALKQRLGQFC